MSLKYTLAIVLVSSLWLAQSTSAALILFTATADNHSGSTLTGSIEYDESTTDTNPSSSVGLYPGAGTVTITSITVGSGNPQAGATGMLAGKNITVVNQAFNDSFTIQTGAEVDHMYLADSSGTVFSSDALPSTLILGQFSSAAALAIGSATLGSGLGQETYTITSMTTVPEPSSLVLVLGTCCGALCNLRRKRKTQRTRLILGRRQ